MSVALSLFVYFWNLMVPFEVTFLGTGTSQGVPIIGCTCEVCKSNDPKDQRLRCSIMVKTEGFSFVIDTGPDFRYQMLRGGFDDLDAVVFTHEHKDHVAGLDDIRPINFLKKKRIDVYATEQVQQALKREFSYIFAEKKYPGIPEVTLNTIHNEAFELGPFHVVPIQVYHYKLPVLGFRIGGFVYITDANSISDEEKDKIKGCDVLVLNALRRESHVSHFTFDQAQALVKELAPKQAYFTHISHQLGLSEEVSKELPHNIALAYDGLKLKFE